MANVDIATKARWQDVANFVLGAWLFISPWVLGFSDAVATNAWIFGIIIALLALSAIFAYQVGRVADGSHRRLGVHLPMGVGRASNARILWSSLIVGALLVILALWSSSLEHGSGERSQRDADTRAQSQSRISGEAGWPMAGPRLTVRPVCRPIEGRQQRASSRQASPHRSRARRAARWAPRERSG